VTLEILYRGPLASCNYGCEYCPFAKRVDSRADLDRDGAALTRFVDWVESRESETSVFFTPWGEALIRRSYQRALGRLTNMQHVQRAAIQTNLSCKLSWLDDINTSKLGIWATYHPDWVDFDRFVQNVSAVHERGASISAGVVGFREYFDQIEALREALPADIYLWINANKRDAGYYSEADICRLERVDPHFRTNTIRHASRGHLCAAGHHSISVDGDGSMRRCHFIEEPIGNIYDPSYAERLKPRPCSNDTCGCHIGYVHLDRLGLREVYGAGILERVPRPTLITLGDATARGSYVASSTLK
jgi:MoaA/NifB/PqqE/SkfB family radical SAM enzyme